MDASPDGERHVMSGTACADPARHSLPDGAAPTIQPTRRYFGHARSRPPLQAHIDLGLAMRFDDHDVDSGIPAGYTYLGQFIFHDISYLKTEPTRPLEPENLRSAALDLDSVFGPVDYSDLVAHGPPPPAMPLGATYSQGNPIDLPRTATGCPLTADPRSDDLLPLAQIHMAVIRFHNAVLDAVGDAQEARRLCVEHFQSVVLHDYLPRVVDPEVHDDVCRNGRAVIHTQADKEAGQPFLLPLEFAAAVGRFGHSMVRNGYRAWNNRNAVVRADGFWTHTYNSGSPPIRRLSDEWRVLWSRLFPTRRSDAVLMGSRIGTRLASPLGRMPAHAHPHADIAGAAASANLAVRTLERGWRLELASGQEVAAEVAGRLRAARRLAIRPLSPDELLANEKPECARLMERHGGETSLLRSTPLWFYVLKESETVAGGLRLGPLGSRIVMETLHAAIEAATPSILSPRVEWRCDPRLPLREEHCSFPDLLEFSGLLECIPTQPRRTCHVGL